VRSCSSATCSFRITRSLEDLPAPTLIREGRLDPSFSGDGKLTLNFTTSGVFGTDHAQALALTADGKSVYVSSAADDSVGDSDYGALLSFTRTP